MSRPIVDEPCDSKLVDNRKVLYVLFNKLDVPVLLIPWGHYTTPPNIVFGGQCIPPNKQLFEE